MKMKIFILAFCFTAFSCFSCVTLSDSYRKELVKRNEEDIIHLADRLIDIKCVNTINDGQTLLHACVQMGNLVCVKKLLDNGADPNIKNNYDRTALFYAERDGPSNVTAAIVAHLNITTDGATEKNCQLNSTEWDQIYFDAHKPTLMQIVADGKVNYTDQNERGQTMLHTFAYRNMILWVKFLLENGADPNIKDYYGKTPIEYAKDNSEIVSLLTNAIQSTTQ